MKNPVRIIVINLILIVVMIGLLIGATQIDALNGGSIVLGGISLGSGNDSFLIDDSSFEKGSEGSVDASEVRELDIAWTAGTVNVVLSDSDTIRFSETSRKELEDDQLMRWKLEKGRLSIRFGTKGGLFRQDPDKTLTVELPADWAAEAVELQTVSAGLSLEAIVATDLTVDTVSGGCTAEVIEGKNVNFNSVSGAVRVSELKCERMTVDNVSGSVALEDAAVTNRLEVSTVSGKVRFTGSADELSVDTTSGDAELNFTEAGSKIEVDSTSGDATVTLPADVSGFVAEIDSTSGELTCEFNVSHRGDYIRYGDEALEIEMDTTSGDLRIKKAA